MTETERGLLRLYGLKSLDEATEENWPWWGFVGGWHGCDRPHYTTVEVPEHVLAIVEKLREKLIFLEAMHEGWRFADENDESVTRTTTLTGAVREALRFIGEERG